MMQLLHMVRGRLLTVRAAAREFLGGSKLRIAVVVGLLGLFWVLMLGMFLEVFMFVRSFRDISAILLDYLFAFLFLSLAVMMTISNAVIAYASLFHSEETEFLFSLPARPQGIFAFRGSDSIVFSLWGIGTLILPLTLSYAIVFRTPRYFCPVALLLAGFFAALTTEAGALLALLTAILLPRPKKALLIALGSAIVLAGAVRVLPAVHRILSDTFTEGRIKVIMDRIAFSQHWALPSRWVSQGILLAGRGQMRQAAFFLLMLLSNVLFFGMISWHLSACLYRQAWEAVQGSSTKRSYCARGPLDWTLRHALFFLPPLLRELVIKDVKTFLRDPSQWSQFLLFFGLLALYVLNLPRFNVRSLEPYWHSLIATLNLAASCLTLATLTTRFVFPQLSLEGRRIWVTGLVPMRRTMILWGKFLFATAGTFVTVGTLVALSDLFLGLPAWVLAVHIVVVACVCCGLNGLAVGLGALYPRMGTDNPSKIVSSFGGTLNLICSICFITLAIAPVVWLLHMHLAGVWDSKGLAASLSAGLVVLVGISGAACVVPMVAGARAFSRMEF